MMSVLYHIINSLKLIERIIYLLVEELDEIDWSLTHLLVNLETRHLCFIFRSDNEFKHAQKLIQELKNWKIQIIIYKCNVVEVIIRFFAFIQYMKSSVYSNEKICSNDNNLKCEIKHVEAVENEVCMHIRRHIYISRWLVIFASIEVNLTLAIFNLSFTSFFLHIFYLLDSSVNIFTCLFILMFLYIKKL